MSHPTIIPPHRTVTPRPEAPRSWWQGLLVRARALLRWVRGRAPGDG